MTKESYEKLLKPFKENKTAATALNALDKTLTALIYISYPCLLFYLLLFCREKLIKSVLVPAIMLVLVSILRKIINRPRPYAAFNTEAVIKKDKQGESMPSRHAFSVFIIAMTFLYCFGALSIPVFAVGVILGAVRIFGGVHYPSDIAAGAAIGIISGLIGFFVL